MAATLALAVALVPLGIGLGPLAAPAGANPTPAPTGPAGPAPAYRCTFNVTTDAFTGANGTAGAIGWLGDHNSVITCLGGTFVVQDGPGGLFQDYGFGIYEGQRTTWADAGGFLPAQVTTFDDQGATIFITEFADRVVLGGNPYVAVYSRVRIDNATVHRHGRSAASSTLVPLDTAPVTVPAHHAVNHDYVVATDRFGGTARGRTRQQLADAGGFDRHYAHMRAFWTGQLTAIAQIDVPDPALVDAYKSGFITTQLTRSGNALDTGVNGYEMEFSHDVIGILTNLFTQGYFTGAHALLTEARNAVGPQGQYVDGLWTYALPWAVYLLKTGDKSFVAQNFATEGPQGSAQPSIEDSAHAIAAARTGPLGTMEATNDIDTQGYWTTDDYEALLGLAAYRYLASALGNSTEAAWATTEYNGLLAAVNTVLGQTIARNGLDYLPCSLLQPNSANRCTNPSDANWTSPFGFGSWAWEGYLLGAPTERPRPAHDRRHLCLRVRPPPRCPPARHGRRVPGRATTRAATTPAMGAAGLAGVTHRDQGILGYEFMIANSQSGPWSWWESSSAPDPATPWVGRHPATGQGSSPHAWGLAGANKVLLDSLVAVRAGGALVVGRGVPPTWLRSGTPITVTNFPTTSGRRAGVTIAGAGRSVSLTLHGASPQGSVQFALPAFIDNIARASTGTVDEATGTVTMRPTVRHVTVTLRTQPTRG